MSRKIALCSDKTGNRWGVGNQTNVSKLYKAVQTVGPKRQIRFYDNGVGTSSNKYLKAITGAFGFGLRKNVLDLYEFLARSYQTGDDVYVFGFSRGAATVRAFAGMLQECGLVWIDGDHPDSKCYDEERLDELLELAKDAYSKRDPEKPEANLALKEKFWSSVEASEGGFHLQKVVPIKMLGVWDTVSALGFPVGPFELKWLFRLLERLTDLLFPHTFYNYRLDGRVEHVCHALAIDDERRTFRPMVWNELHGPRPRHIEQVWFAGMHSDVGGGCARTGLSSASLEWMMAHASKNGLELRDLSLDTTRNKANPHGKMHNSRDGFSIYYRYLPRDLVRLCEKGLFWKSEGKTKYRLEEGEEPKVREGEVKIHRSVLERLQEGTARYAPGLLPRSFEVVGNPGDLFATRSVTTFGAWQQCRDAIVKVDALPQHPLPLVPLRDPVDAEKRFLVLDLLFPPVYGVAFAASLLIGFHVLGWGKWASVLAVLVVVAAAVADRVESLVHLHQLGRFRIGRLLDEAAIGVASRATVVKIWGLCIAGLSILALSLGVLGRALWQALA